MPSDDDPLGRLREVLNGLAEADVRMVLDAARADAHKRVRAILSKALEQSLLEAVEVELRGERATPTGKHPEPSARVEAAPRDRSVTAHARPAAQSEMASYVYGVVPAESTLPDLPAGIDGRAVRTVREGTLCAVTSDVDTLDFDEERLREHLGDMAWVEETARRHEEVLEAVSAAATVVPMRMCTVYESQAGIQELLRRECAPLQDALDVLDGKSEWGVKVSFDPSAAPLAEEDSQDVYDLGASGAAYMQRRLGERDARARHAQALEEAATSIHEQLSQVAADAVVAPPQRPEASGRGVEMVLNGVYLVGGDARERFHAQVSALAEEFGPLGLVLDMTGPWPAYNFVPGTIGAAW